MPPVPVIRPDEAVVVFESFGWEVVRRSGSHIIMVRPGHNATLCIPNHREVARGTLRSLIRSAELTVAEFVAAL